MSTTYKYPRLSIPLNQIWMHMGRPENNAYFCPIARVSEPESVCRMFFNEIYIANYFGLSITWLSHLIVYLELKQYLVSQRFRPEKNDLFGISAKHPSTEVAKRSSQPLLYQNICVTPTTGNWCWLEPCWTVLSIFVVQHFNTFV